MTLFALHPVSHTRQCAAFLRRPVAVFATHRHRNPDAADVPYLPNTTAELRAEWDGGPGSGVGRAGDNSGAAVTTLHGHRGCFRLPPGPCPRDRGVERWRPVDARHS